MCHDTVRMYWQAEQAHVLLTWSAWFGREAKSQMWDGEKRHLKRVRGPPWGALGACRA